MGLTKIATPEDKGFFSSICCIIWSVIDKRGARIFPASFFDSLNTIAHFLRSAQKFLELLLLCFLVEYAIEYLINIFTEVLHGYRYC
jgi:hypothetical protein